MHVISIVNNKPYSWDAANNEISAGTESGNKILDKMRVVGII